MTAIRLIPKNPQIPLPQCSAVVKMPTDTNYRHVHSAWRKKKYGFNGDQCQKHATIVICERPMCESHAGKLALQLLLGEK